MGTFCFASAFLYTAGHCQSNISRDRSVNTSLVAFSLTTIFLTEAALESRHMHQWYRLNNTGKSSTKHRELFHLTNIITNRLTWQSEKKRDMEMIKKREKRHLPAGKREGGERFCIRVYGGSYGGDEVSLCVAAKSVCQQPRQL